MGVGFIVIVTAVFGATLAIFLTMTNRLGILASTAISLATAILVSSLLFPMFPWDSPFLSGALLRFSGLVFLPIFTAAAAGKWLRKMRED